MYPEDLEKLAAANSKFNINHFHHHHNIFRLSVFPVLTDIRLSLSHYCVTMKSLSIAAIAIVGVVTQIPTATAFTTVTYSTSTRPSSSTQLYSVEDMRQRIKKAGGGITTVVPGDLKVYDPNEQGKLQGTGDLEARVSAGASFPGETSSPAPESPVVVTSEAAAAAPSATSGGIESNTKPAGMTNLTNLLDSVRPRKDAYGGKSQC
eukprot:scaffold25970_cov155-Skeletonema_dohrnii-CCMP3373.AAC.3